MAKIYTVEQFQAAITASLDEGEDNYGQIIFYTGFYNWKDGTIRDEPEFSGEDDTE